MFTPKIATTLKDYSAPVFAADVMAGVTVGLVALPLSLAIAIASGATPAQGLVTAIVGGLIRAGSLVAYVPEPVINGFTLALP